MNIKTINNKTCVLVPKYQFENLKQTFAAIKELNDVNLTWKTQLGYFQVSQKLDHVLISKLKEKYIYLFKKPEIITGFTGCLVTLNSFNWEVR